MTKLVETAAQIHSSVRKNETHGILLGKSGIGKTRTILDVAKNLFTLYIVTDLESYDLDWRKEDKTLRIINHRLYVEISARLMFLYKYSQLYPALTPQQYLLSQLNGAQKSIMRILRQLERINHQDTKTLPALILRYLEPLLKQNNQNQLIVAVDEAASAHEFWNGKFKSTNKASEDYYRIFNFLRNY